MLWLAGVLHLVLVVPVVVPARISVVVGLALVFVVSENQPFVDSTDVVGCVVVT